VFGTWYLRPVATLAWGYSPDGAHQALPVRLLARAADRVNGTSNSTAPSTSRTCIAHPAQLRRLPPADPGLAQVRHVLRRLLLRRGQVRQFPAGFGGRATTAAANACPLPFSA